MTVNLKLEQGREEYLRKLKAGEIEKPENMTPIEKAKQNPRSLRAAVNAKCFDCCCYSRTEVRDCTAVNCPLYFLRPWQGKARDLNTIGKE
ncbi:hypothetical protein [Desulfobacula sp.]|uniref:hypothetical protein n=1 Tax=Desulfobacula sp. TaxID=2593537 RepID=UPI002605E90B|nr:hypothetical protein [Desulfobacula sp.]